MYLSCFFVVPLDHKIYTESHRYMKLNTDSNEMHERNV